MREILIVGTIKKEGAPRSYLYALFACPICGKAVEKIRKDGKRAKTCSIKCSRKFRGPKGNRNKDGVMISGYRYVYAPKHPYGTKCYVAEHRYIMEAAIKRFLRPDEVVHHINGKKTDNRIENLQLLSNSEHGKLHAEMSTICRRGK